MNPKDSARMYSKMTSKMNRSDPIPNESPLNSQNSRTITIESKKLISDEIVPEMTMMYFGKFIFLSKSPFETIELKEKFVASEKKFHMTIPKSR
jgi:hypothetical protein